MFLMGFLTVSSIEAQQFTQTIKGQVLDAESGSSLVGATIIIRGTDPLIGTVTDLDGKFRIEKVPVGRYDLTISFVGYEIYVVRDLIVGSVKEVVIQAGLIESVQQMDAVEIVARQDMASSAIFCAAEPLGRLPT